MIILIDRWKRKLVNLAAVLALLIAFAAALPVMIGILHQKVPALSGWFQDEHPTGNPMRVEQENKSGTRFDQAVDQFVIKLQNFYYEEKQ